MAFPLLNLSFRGQRQQTVSIVFSRALTEKVPSSLNEGRSPIRIESLSNHDNGHNDNFEKNNIGLMIKTTALHVHHAF